MTAVGSPPGQITRRSGVALARAIRAGELSSREVVEAHIEAAERLNPRVNAIVADRFDAAREEADRADERVRSAGEGEELPPFLGVPCTIKESFALEGMPNCAGWVRRKDHRAAEDATVVARIREAGAIPIGVTNTSELTMWIESRNRLYGLTRNAYDPARTAGGSSGGEGAAVGSGMAPFGIGTDIGGSIRVPAFFNGVFGHKNSAGLVSAAGHFPASEGESHRMLGIGPLARSADDLMPVLRAIHGPDGKDRQVREIGLGDPSEVSIEGLSVVVSEDTTTVRPPSRELRRAREMAAGALAERGAKVRHESLKSVRRALSWYLATLGSGGEDVRTMVFGEDGQMGLIRMSANTARRSGTHTWPTVLLILGDRLNGPLMSRGSAKAIAAGKALAEEISGVIGDGVLLHPPFARVAPRHSGTVGRVWLVMYPGIFNLTGLPATTVPLGLGRRGLPLGVQVAARHGADHRTIAVAQALEADFGGWVPPEHS
jgi:fatty acid amide hydrolase 2